MLSRRTLGKIGLLWKIFYALDKQIIILATHAGLVLLSSPLLLDWEQSLHRSSLEVEMLLQQIPYKELQSSVKNQFPKKPFFLDWLRNVAKTPWSSASHFSIASAETERPGVASGHRKPWRVHFPQAFEDGAKQVCFIKKRLDGRGQTSGYLRRWRLFNNGR